jgi:hypothetical protein
MKLYGTITSERASKGQGGNEYLKIDLTDSNGDFLGKIHIHLRNDTIGDITYADIDFAEYVYVNGHHWLDAEINAKKSPILEAIKAKTYRQLEKELKELQAFLREETSSIGRQDLLLEQAIIKELDERDRNAKKQTLCNCGMNPPFHEKQSNCKTPKSHKRAA